MPSEVDICNLALSHLGDEGNVSGLSPPAGGMQARLCAIHYPLARDSLLAMHAWNFATTRDAPPLLDVELPPWAFAYAPPANCLAVIAVLPPDAGDDYDEEAAQSYVLETTPTGVHVLLTNQEDALVRHTQRVTDTSRFPPLFLDTLSWLLASNLAGPIIKGDVGAAEAKRCLEQFRIWFGMAASADARQRRVRPTHRPAWIKNR